MILISKTLNTFITIVNEKSMKNATVALCMTASPLWRNIKILETSLGYKLFTRKNRNLILTNRGEEFYKEIYPYFSAIDNIEKKYFLKRKEHLKITHETWINIGANHSHSGYSSKFISSPNIYELGVNFKFSTYNDASILELIKTDDCHIFISTEVIEHDTDIVFVQIPIDEIALAISNKILCGNLKHKDIMTNYPFVQPPEQKNTHYFQKIENIFKINEIKTKRIIIPDTIDQLSIIENGLAFGIIPTSMQEIVSDKYKGITLQKLDNSNHFKNNHRYIYFHKKNERLIKKHILTSLIESM